jgi:hypothetical protein
MVPRTGGDTYDVGVRDLSIMHGPFSVAPCPTLMILNFCIAVCCRDSDKNPNCLCTLRPVAATANSAARGKRGELWRFAAEDKVEP